MAAGAAIVTAMIAVNAAAAQRLKFRRANDIVSSLTGSVKTKKHITTKIEYFCNDSEDAERVFEKVTEVLSDNIDDFAKITFDYNAGENKVDVEVIEHV